ncbi:MAG: hypothetical protein GF331_16245 [Chitinivibrionales bacterium]|nr:hypothetical protein [Chitinivibrionales bacterium]
MLKSRIQEASEVDITPMIDMVFQLIIFFMVVMAIAVVYGVAIKFPPRGEGKPKSDGENKKRVNVYVQQDRITENHVVIRDGILKINGEEIALTRSPLTEYLKWEQERKEGFDALQHHMQRLIEKGYETDILYIQGDMKSYHGKVMRVIDRGKRVKIPGETEVDSKSGEVRQKYGIDGFSLVPPQ